MIAEVRRYETLDSTNQEARRLAQSGERAPLWIVAREQTAGRGRRGRVWVSRPGNLFATYFTAVPKPAELCAQLSFAAGLAVADAIAPFAANARIALKWPNDVLLDGRKAAGVLLEASPLERGLNGLGVGFGINLAHFPEGTEFPATSIAAVTGRAPAPDDVFARLGKTWDTWYEAWRANGFAALRGPWLARAAGLGEKIGARLANTEMTGIFETLDDEGGLVLRRGHDKTRITAGEIFFPS